jgi:hypothetical protein
VCGLIDLVSRSYVCACIPVKLHARQPMDIPCERCVMTSYDPVIGNRTSATQTHRRPNRRWVRNIRSHSRAAHETTISATDKVGRYRHNGSVVPIWHLSLTSAKLHLECFSMGKPRFGGVNPTRRHSGRRVSIQTETLLGANIEISGSLIRRILEGIYNGGAK